MTAPVAGPKIADRNARTAILGCREVFGIPIGICTSVRTTNKAVPMPQATTFLMLILFFFLSAILNLLLPVSVTKLKQN